MNEDTNNGNPTAPEVGSPAVDNTNNNPILSEANGAVSGPVNNDIGSPVSSSEPVNSPVVGNTQDNNSADNKTKKSNLSAIVIAAVIVLCIVGGGVLALSLGNKAENSSSNNEVGNSSSNDKDNNSSSNSESGNSSSDDGDEDKPSNNGAGDKSSTKARIRDEKREDDIARFITAVQQFQTNNNGKTPLMVSGGMSSFVRRYIDKGCSEGDNSDDPNVYSFGGTCTKDFSDPDGTEYKVRVAEVPSNKSSGDKWVVPDMDTMSHEIVFISGARCGDEGEVIINTASKRLVSILYKAEREIICIDTY